MREINKICLGGVPIIERTKTREIISAALVAQYHKNILVLDANSYSDDALSQIPQSIKVFVICYEDHHSASQVSHETNMQTMPDQQA